MPPAHRVSRNASMKHFFFCFCAVLVLTFGPLRVASAQHWWRHAGPGPAGAGADKISKLTWPRIRPTYPHTSKAQYEKPTPLYTSPKSVGWWQKSPGPMGVGADKITWASGWNFRWTKPHFRKAQLEKPTALYTSPKSVGWWHKVPGPAGAGPGN